MNYLYESIKPTRLYIKKCPHCNLKYFGKTSSDKIGNYSGSGLIWKSHLKKHNVVPIHIWNSDWYYDSAISIFALEFSKLNNIVESSDWANIKNENGLDGGGPGEFGKLKISETRKSEEWVKNVGEKAAKKCSETKRSKEWKETVGKKAAKKCSDTQNDPDWKETVGKEKVRKDLEKKYDPEWKATVGKDAKQKEHATKSNPSWKETVGKKAAKKFSDTINSKEWKNTVGKDKAKKISKIQNNEEWKLKNFKTCEICGKKKISPGNYSRWHGPNCKKTSKIT